MNRLRTKEKFNYWYDLEYEGANLITKGVLNPEDFIEKSLRKKTDLIPIQAVLGGSMYFGKIQLLGSEWLIADFDDGHIRGRAIYSYKLTSKRQLEFELLISDGPE